MRGTLTIVAVCAALTVQAGFSAVQAANAGGVCSDMTTTKYIMSDVTDTATSTHWVNLTDAKLTFTMAGLGCARVTFSAPATILNSGQHSYTLDDMHVRVLLDGNSLCAPALQDDTFFADATNDSFYLVHATSFTRLCKNLPAGMHTVQMQYRDDQGFSAIIYGHALTVTHN